MKSWKHQEKWLHGACWLILNGSVTISKHESCRMPTWTHPSVPQQFIADVYKCIYIYVRYIKYINEPGARLYKALSSPPHVYSVFPYNIFMIRIFATMPAYEHPSIIVICTGYYYYLAVAFNISSPPFSLFLYVFCSRALERVGIDNGIILYAYK